MDVLHFLEMKILLPFAELFKIHGNVLIEWLSMIFSVALLVCLLRACIRVKKYRKDNREVGFKGFYQAIFFYVLLALTAVMGLCFVVHMSLVMYIATTPAKLQDFAFDEDAFTQKLVNIDIYDQKGNKVYTIVNDGVNREAVTLNEMPPYLKEAFVNVEDKDFYTHSGISVQGYLRAIYYKIKNPSGSMNGGSTLTQQLVKNVNGDMYNRNLLHKYQEALLSIVIENKYSKKEILEMYLNRIYLGEGSVYGVATAAKQYFNKDVSELTLSESAFLAGLPQAPSAYTKDLTLGNQRKNTVLAVMKENGTITENQWKKATQQTIVFTPHTTEQTALDAYVDYVLKEAKQSYGLNESDLKHNGYSIYTYLDTNLQTTMYQTAQSFSFKDDTSQQHVQAGIAAVNPTTGKLSALYGGRGYVRGYRNRSYDRFQPGSILKPLIVYGPAFESKKWSPFSRVTDEKRTFGSYAPKNAGERYEGDITLERALIRSANIPAVTVFQDVGIEKGIQTLKKLNIPVEEKDKELHLALGGMEKGVTPIEMAQAYAIFPNYGYFEPTEAIKMIKDQDEHILPKKEELHKKATDIFSAETAYHMTEILKKVISDPSGTGRNAYIGRPVAGKTGTAEEAGTSGNRASWFVGYTRDISMAIHLGFDKPSKDLYLTTTGGDEPAKLFAAIMKKAYANTPAKDFDKPTDVTSLAEGPLLTKVQNVQASFDKETHHVTLTWDQEKDLGGIVYKIFEKGPRGKDIEVGTTTGTEFVDQRVSMKDEIGTVSPDANWFEKTIFSFKTMFTLLKNALLDKRTYYVIATYQNKAAEPSDGESIFVRKVKEEELK